jgi:protein-tyrosine phosphatase
MRVTERQLPPEASDTRTAPMPVSSTDGVQVARNLGLGGALNARDLGGYRTSDGRTLRHSVALRSDALHRLTSQDLTVLTDLGLRQVVDLRGLAEIRENGPDRVPGLPIAEIDTVERSEEPVTLVPDGADGVTLHHLPIYARDFDIYVALRDALAGRDPASQRALLGNGNGAAMMTGLYRWFVTSAEARERFAQVLRLLAQPGGTPLLFHCTAGKDRTGWTAALLLTVLGVERGTVFEDYLLTNDRHAALVERILDGFGTRGVMEEPELILPIYRAEEMYLAAAFDAVEAGWPSFDAFVADGLALDRGVVDGLRRNLLLPA